MLARANRVILADDFRTTVRRGRRSGGPLLVVHVRSSEADRPVRFGFIVAKTVGGAVVRNTVRRRLRASAYAMQSQLAGIDVVVRALPASATASQAQLAAALGAGLRAQVGRSA